MAVLHLMFQCAQRRKVAARKVAQLKKKGQSIQPVNIEGRVIAKTFWGKAACDNLESYSDFEIVCREGLNVCTQWFSH